MKRFNHILLLAAVVLAASACTKGNDPTGEEDLSPGVVCHQAVSGSALKGEKITVSLLNLSPETEVTVKFGKEKTVTHKGSGVVSYAFEQYGSKTITVTMVPEEVEKQTFKVYVEKLEALQVVAKKLKENPKLCLVMAHRGNSSDFSIPENSLPAIEKCVADKVDIFEMDLFTTKDGVLVVSHDSDLGRETTGSGSIKSKTLEQIKSYNLKDRNGNATSEKMLTFDEFLDACKGRIYINVDIGDRDVNIPEAVKAVYRKGMTQQVLFYCNTQEKIRAALSTNPDCNAYSWVSQAQYLVDNGNADYLYFTQCGWNPTTAAASANGKVDSGKQPTSASTVASAVNAGTILTVNAIYTLNTAQLYPRNFTQAQVEDIYKVFPATSCIHVDTPAEARAALLAAGKQLLNN
ncbi:MAG: glycerophosphodiester phosphodiesterase family protein [Bacteroidales bacterium]|nr:glycerophosphodiester phosphodiesterase family protein [Bacteroidales bacterium]